MLDVVFAHHDKLHYFPGFISALTVVELFADLIDRPTCRNDDGLTERAFACSECGYVAWTYNDSGCDPSDFLFCPKCGAKVVMEVVGDDEG